MRRSSSTTRRGAKDEAQSKANPRRKRLLVVDPDRAARKVIEACALQGPSMLVFFADSGEEARRRMTEMRSVDLVVIAAELADGPGVDLARHIAASRRVTEVVMLGDEPTAQQTVEAMRAGACDFLSKPLDMEEVNLRLRQAVSRRDALHEQVKRVRRLRRLCKKLNQDRQDISAQVDVLCNDLVTAYQELAEQMNSVAATSEYQALIRNELDLEPLLRTTLEHLVQKVGPTNAAIFLPSTMDEYSLAGYVNYDCPSDSAGMLLDHLADVLAPKLSDGDEMVHINDDRKLTAWLGDDAAYLAGTDVIAVSARSKAETLAVLTLFRDGDQPFDRDALETCAAVGPMLGEALAKVIKIHHRHLPDLSDADEGFEGQADDDDPFGDAFEPGGDDIPF